MTLTTLLHGRHQDPHMPPVRYEPFGPWLVPWTFTTFKREYDALRTKVGLADYSICSFIECQGADRLSFLQRLLTNDLRRLTPGSSCPAALLSPQGKLIAETLVIATEHSILLMCDLRQAAALEKALSHYLFSEHVNLINRERRFAMLGFQGPALNEQLAQLFPKSPKLAQPGAHAVVSWDGIPLWLLRYSPTGGDDPQMVCFVPADDAANVWRQLAKQIEPVGWETLNAVRLEHGCPWLGIDYDESNLPGEVGLDRVLVSGSKGCYVGQEIVARMDTYGSASKKLMWLRTDGPSESVPQAGDSIMRGEELVGRVTSGSRSPRFEHPVALGFVKRGAYESAAPVTILRGMQRLSATPFDLNKLGTSTDFEKSRKP